MNYRTILAAAGAALAMACSSETKTETAARPEASRAADRAFEELAAPSDDGAAEPFLFPTQTGVGLSWLEPVSNSDRVALRLSQYDGGRWTTPRTVAERNDLFVNWADFPSVVVDSNGTLFAHWLQKSGTGKYAYDVRMATSPDGGATWTESFLLNRDGKQSEHGFVTLAPLPGGGVGATWLDGRNMKMDGGEDHGDMTIRYATVDAEGRLTSDESLDERACECCTTGMTITGSGPVIVYRDRSPDEIRDISYVRRDAKGWTEPKAVRADGWKINGCPVNGPQIDSMGQDVVTAWFTAANGRPRVYVAWSHDSGATFGEAVAVDDGKPVGRVDIVMTDAKTAVVSWLEQTAAGAEIRARRVPIEGKADPSRKIADSATARATGFTRLVARGHEVWFAWTEQSGTSKRVRVGRTRF